MAKKNQFFKLDMLLLCIIAKQDCYGYEITKQIKTYSHELIDIKEGTMYPNGVNLRGWLFFIAVFPTISVYSCECS